MTDFFKTKTETFRLIIEVGLSCWFRVLSGPATLPSPMPTDMISDEPPIVFFSDYGLVLTMSGAHIGFDGTISESV